MSRLGCTESEGVREHGSAKEPHFGGGVPFGLWMGPRSSDGGMSSDTSPRTSAPKRQRGFWAESSLKTRLVSETLSRASPRQPVSPETSGPFRNYPEHHCLGRTWESSGGRGGCRGRGKNVKRHEPWHRVPTRTLERSSLSGSS